MSNQKKQATKFADLINGDSPLLVDFYTTWCGPCKMMAPILRNLKTRMGDQLTIIKIDAEKNPEASDKYQIRGVPTLILFHKGKIIWRQSGVIQARELQQIISGKIDR